MDSQEYLSERSKIIYTFQIKGIRETKNENKLDFFKVPTISDKVKNWDWTPSLISYGGSVLEQFMNSRILLLSICKYGIVVHENWYNEFKDNNITDVTFLLIPDLDVKYLYNKYTGVVCINNNELIVENNLQCFIYRMWIELVIFDKIYKNININKYAVMYMNFYLKKKS